MRLLSRLEYRTVGKTLLFLSEKKFDLSTKKLSRATRVFVSLAQPSNPWNETQIQAMPTIDVVIPCHQKDFQTLNLVIHSVYATVQNPIRKVSLITPNSFKSALSSQFPECVTLADEDIIPRTVSTFIEEIVPKKFHGWVRQQVIKILGVLSSDSEASLVLDADTILLQRRQWYSESGKQILCLAYEYHQPYKMQQRNFLGGSNQAFSFVTHHQLMQKRILAEIFGDHGEKVRDWIAEADFRYGSALSEYDTYGEYLMMNHRDRILFSKWNNVVATLNTGSGLSYLDVSSQFPGYASISNHSWQYRSPD